MSLTCRRLSLLLLLCVVVDTGMGTTTLMQSPVRGNDHTLRNALFQTLTRSSMELPAASFRQSNVSFETGPKNSNSSTAQPQSHDDQSNASYAVGFNSVSKAGMLSDLLKYIHSSINIRGNVLSHGDNRLPHSSLQSSTTTSVMSKVNRQDVVHGRSVVNRITAHPVPMESSMPFQNRTRRDAFPLLPNNYMDRQTYFSPSETCRQQELILVLRPPGCLRRVVHTSSCQGTCHSRSVPHWDIDLQQLRQVAYCTCCKPHQLTYRRTRFRCPGRQRRVLVMYVGVATQCACRPCAEADPSLQQPYDY